MHHHVQKRAELERRGIEPSLLASLPGMAYRPHQPVGIGADREGYRVGQRGADLDHSRSGGGYVDRHLRQIAAGDPLVAAAVAVVERDLFAAQESLHLRNVSSEVFARRRARANLGDRRIAAPDAEDCAPARLRLNGRDRRCCHSRMPRYRVGNCGPQLQMFGGVRRDAQLGVRIRCQVLSIDHPDAVEAALFDHPRHLAKGAGGRKRDHPYFRIALIHSHQPRWCCAKCAGTFTG